MANLVLESIRRSLGRTAQAPVEQPASPRPPVLPARQPGPVEAEIELFLTELKALSAVGRRLTPTDVAGALTALVAGQDIHKASVWETPYLKELKIAARLEELGVELVSPDADKLRLAQCDLGVTEADFILPETGTLVLRSSAEKPRAVSLLPRVHLAVATPSALRADLHQVFAEAKDSPYVVFITGPSRTSDIELTVTLGVHGPKFLVVWIVGQ